LYLRYYFLYKANWAKYEIVKIFFKGKDYGQKIR
jgi:hypothetical protein